jgi:mannose-1-phosphate guanylyltransferase/mannose-1-phosphate guanylyltransferase/mannose-6-phosphate isomerase
MTIYPAILCGGSGTRLWPLSRGLYPKQFLPIAGERTLLQQTAARVSGDGFGAPLLICNAEHRFLVAEQMREAGLSPGEIVLEPVARSTAPAAAVAAHLARAAEADAQVLLLPSDHVVADAAAFARAVATAAQAAKKGRIVTFGMAAETPETGYGYIRRGAALAGVEGAYEVDQFVEKPSQEDARRMLADGGYDWNSGMFLFSAAAYLDELAALEPVMAAACARAVDAGARDLDFLRLDAAAFSESPANSIDVAVMERTDKAAVVPCELGWSDVGAWSSLWDIAERDTGGNVMRGDVVADGVSGSYLHSDGPMLAAIGLADMVVVATDDAVLVTPRGRAADVKAMVERLKRDGRSQHHAHLKVHRPWGWYQNIDNGDGFQVKRICVKPGARLSLQYHHKRAEHWVVVSGRARVTRGDEVVDLSANQSTYIPIGERHRLENPGTEPVHLIEVQSGSYLGEDDIVRLEDDFAREKDT